MYTHGLALSFHRDSEAGVGKCDSSDREMLSGWCLVPITPAGGSTRGRVSLRWLRPVVEEGVYIGLFLMLKVARVGRGYRETACKVRETSEIYLQNLVTRINFGREMDCLTVTCQSAGAKRQEGGTQTLARGDCFASWRPDKCQVDSRGNKIRSRSSEPRGIHEHQPTHPVG